MARWWLAVGCLAGCWLTGGWLVAGSGGLGMVAGRRLMTGCLSVAVWWLPGRCVAGWSLPGWWLLASSSLRVGGMLARGRQGAEAVRPLAGSAHLLQQIEGGLVCA